VGDLTPARARARVHLVALAVWLGELVVIVVRDGERRPVTTVGQAFQLAVMFTACVVICGVAWLITRDTELPASGVGALPTDEYLRRALSFSLRLWLLLLGGGVPAALRALGSGR
jgi:hypothetical protein